ncbi:c-type cytochrome [Arhodomonas sp. SL1]|uniref:c-type cytochrome n=1 Tax=Arhodomonas sp. SL1 TaxID=3425691 RepID=UPI003F881AEC
MSREEDRKFIRNFVAVIAGLVVTAIVLIIIATMLYDGDEEARRQLTAERAAKNLAPVGSVRLTGDPMPQAASAGGAGEEEAADSGAGDRSGEEVAMQVCAACHESGTLGAPVFGDEEAWSPRVDKGLATLVDHSMNGFNNMPPQSGSATEDEIRKAIVWMVEDAGLSVEGADGAAAEGETADAAPEEDQTAAETADEEVTAEDQATEDQAVASEDGAEPEAPTDGAQEVDLAMGEEVAMRVCAACHQTGAAGAPVFGDEEAWSPRAEKGIATLVDHSVNGFNAMPAQGNMASEEEIRQAILWMLDEAGLSIEGADGAAAEGETADAAPEGEQTEEETAGEAATTGDEAGEDQAVASEDADTTEAQGSEAAETDAAADEAQEVDLAAGEEVAMRVCAACHQTGAAGAPVFGDEEAWAPRAEKDLATLVDHSVNGFNAMPPQGNMASEEEIRQAVLWMLDDAGVSAE